MNNIKKENELLKEENKIDKRKIDSQKKVINKQNLKLKKKIKEEENIETIDINNIIVGSTVFSKLYNIPVIIKNKVSENEVKIKLYNDLTDIVKISDLCYIQFK